MALVLMVMGLRTATELPVEVLPDLSKPTVIILTESAGLSPEDEPLPPAPRDGPLPSSADHAPA